MANDKRFVAKNGLDNNNATITNVGTPVSPSDAANLSFSSNATNLTAGTVSAARLSGTYNIDVSGNAATATLAAQATLLQTARTIAISGTVTGTATSFNGGANISIPITAINASGLTTGTVPDARISGSYTGLTNLTGSGTVDFAKFLGNAADSAAAPSFSFTGDTSTGIYQPAADQLGITTGGTSRLTVSTTAITSALPITATTFNGNLNGNANTATSATSATTATTATNVSGGTASVTTLTASGAAALNGGATTTTLSTTGNVTVGGNLIVNGTTTTVNSSVVTIDDPVFTLGGDTAPTADDNKDRGIEFRWHDGTAARTGFFGFDDSTGFFTFIPVATNTNEVFTGALGVIDATRITGSAASWTTPRNLTISGDASATFSGVNGTANVTATLSLATVNPNVGTFGSASAIPVVTVNAKGLVTAVTTAAIQAGINITNSNVNAVNYLTFTTATSGSVNALNVDSTTTPLTYNPSTNVIGASISGNAATASTANSANTATTATNQSGGSVNATTISGSGNFTLTGSANAISKNNPAISDVSYLAGNNHLELRTSNGSAPSIAFHRAGSSAVTLYHDASNSLRIRDAAGADGRILTDQNTASITQTGGSAPYYGARAWLSLNGGAGGTAGSTIRASANVSSVTSRGSFGSWTLNFLTAMPSTEYAVFGSTTYDGAGVLPLFFPNVDSVAGAIVNPTTTQFVFSSGDGLNFGDRRGSPRISVAVFL